MEKQFSHIIYKIIKFQKYLVIVKIDKF